MAAGMRGVNPRQMQQAMKKMGMKQTDIKNVTEVIIRTNNKEIVITNAEVTLIEMQGSRNYQIAGDEITRELGTASAPATVTFPAEDIELVMSQTGCDKEKAVKALEDAKGQPAEAILKIMTS
ncbi:nascent polypeptide-associated complex protein [Candidatus Methanoplasma termitum]|uniref:Nascent polypeptide-associated complex protein n=1 Tax=Candidatus Methanoplasma termitum TaxID=1577791 RepID=A0A0A7LCD3_9ARCH|nr:nascent polypeptide-associated complex protein [Candidatus Methanoplasma termitum]AIZ55972.1 nascent polypeptide-associated complex protein [Candidatus Methanoplasma termitum]MCL2334416.1 nascent polypeptide-associated complex protein [Candidatus Methanoplasma sp.]